MSQKYCINRAPHVFYVVDGVAYIAHGCCNSWTCPRCGNIRAKQEYRKIVFGAEELHAQGHDLYFITLTCRGRDLLLSDAEKYYYKWTTRLLNACRNELSRRGGYWAYCQVTERQKRLHPHSHLITTYLPKNSISGTKITSKGKIRDVLYSDWFLKRNISAGLGSQYEITEIVSPKGVASYVAKYLFKDAIATEWPKGWRRIRYSRKWPREERPTADDGFPLLNKVDWKRVKDRQTRVTVDELSVYISAKENGIKRIRFLEKKEQS